MALGDKLRGVHRVHILSLAPLPVWLFEAQFVFSLQLLNSRCWESNVWCIISTYLIQVFGRHKCSEFGGAITEA